MKQIKSGVFHFEKALSTIFIETLAKWYSENKSMFYTPVLRSGHSMNLTMCQFGMHWNAKDYKYYKNRTDVDGEPVTSVPSFIKEEIAHFSSECFPYHNPDWDIMIANHYEVSKHKLGMHADNSESREALNIGHPVVSISIGASCIFKIGSPNCKVENLLLNNGDVLVFGGSARLDKHGVAKVYDNGWDNYDIIGNYLDYGRLNLTLRKY